MSLEPASGTQYTLRSGQYVACIASVGASLRSLTYDSRNLVVPYDADEIRPAMRGAILAPWPNRTADGRYRFDGHEHQLAVNESETGHASHGLVAWLRFDAIVSGRDFVTLRGVIEPQPGYPWRIRLDVTYSLSGDGLRLEIDVSNQSAARAPFGIGIHPYLSAGDAVPEAVDSWTLSAPAERVLLTDARVLPVDLVAVGDHASGGLDFRSARVVGSSILNHAYTGLTRGVDRLARVRLTGPDGVGTEIEWDDHCEWVQLYTADELGAGDRRHALAVEPQSCPPDALNSKQDLLLLAPGMTTTFSWSIRATG